MGFWKRLLGREDDAGPGGDPVEALLVNAYATLREPPPLDFPHRPLGARDRSDPALAEHLDGFVGYAMSRGDGQMTAARYYVWRHLQRVRHHLSFEVDPADLPRLEGWARDANAVLFLPDGSIRAPDMAVLLSAEGEGDPAAALPFPPDAVERRTRTRTALTGAVLQPPAGMAPALGEAELVLRPPAEVLGRALALFHVAARAQALAAGLGPIEPGRPERNPAGVAALTPDERAFLADDPADAEAVAAMTWRYEAANTLFWALGVEGASIADSDRLVDVDALWTAVAPFARGEGTAPSLRSPGEILDALDRSWLEHWIVRQARQKDIALERLNGDVVAERHVALNWLTNFQNDVGIAWDDTDTPS